MSEKRKPVAVVSVKRDGVTHKFEVFKSDQFSRCVTGGKPLADDEGIPTLRTRHNGVWLPKRDLMSVQDFMGLVHDALFPAVVDAAPKNL